MGIKVFNTMTRALEALTTKNPERVEFFVCGPTVYDFSHLGHAKTYTQFDFIAKYIRSRGYEVIYAQNITDVDDRIIDRANQRGLSAADLAAEFEKYYIEDMMALHNDSVNIYARAHNYIDQIVDQISRLIEKGYAYRITDGYYFDLTKFPEYGKLSGRSELKPDDSVSRIDENTEKRNPGDFCLWKMRKENEPFWETPLGSGRPGWHIEDTAITEHLFGPQYDIHGGAVDLIFPHHEAEIAQIEAASGLKPMVRHWLHTGFLNLKSGKMSKSKGNFITIRDLLATVNYRVVRFYFISHHYRAPMEWSLEYLEQARNGLGRINNFVRLINTDFDDTENEVVVAKFRKEFYDYLDNDFDTPAAIALLFELIREQNKSGSPGIRILNLMHEINAFFDFISFTSGSLEREIETLIQTRQELRSQRKFKEADELRDRILSQGIVLEDTQQGVRWRYRES